MEQPVTSNDDSSSLTYIVESKSLKKGDYAIINGKPARILEVAWSKMGKVGHPKIFYLAIDLVTGKKLEEMLRSSHRGAHPAHVPRDVNSTEYILLGFVYKDGTYLRLLPLVEDDDEVNDRVLLPNGFLGVDIQNDFEQGKQLVITVHSVLGHEGVVSYKERQDDQQDGQEIEQSGVLQR